MRKIITSMSSRNLSITLLLILCCGLTATAQSRATGNIKGKVRAENGTNEGIKVVARQSETDMATTMTNRKGEYILANLKPGVYTVIFRPGQGSVTIDNVEVQAGKTRSLRERTLPVDIGSIAFLRGSVFNAAGLSVPGVRIELERVEAGGRSQNIGGYVTNSLGEFAFRLPPATAKYRVTARPPGGGSPVSKEVEVDGAYVYRVALSLPAASASSAP